MMTIVERSIFINAPVEAIDSFTSDASRWPEWYVGVEQAEADDTYPQAGGVANTVYKAAGVTFETTFTSQEYSPGQGITQEISGMIIGTWQQRYMPEDDGTWVTVIVNYELLGGAIGKTVDKLLVERMNTQQLKNSLENLKAAMEM